MLKQWFLFSYLGNRLIISEQPDILSEFCTTVSKYLLKGFYAYILAILHIYGPVDVFKSSACIA